MCITVSKARDCRNTYHSSSVIVIYLRFLQSHVGNTIKNTLQCIDCPSRRSRSWKKIRQRILSCILWGFQCFWSQQENAWGLFTALPSQGQIFKVYSTGILFIVLNTSKETWMFRSLQLGCGVQWVILSWCLSVKYLTYVNNMEVQKYLENTHLQKRGRNVG